MFIKLYVGKNYVRFCVIVCVWCSQGLFVCDVETFECLVKMDEDQQMYDSIMSEEVDMNEQNEDESGMNEEHANCSNAFNISQILI